MQFRDELRWKLFSIQMRLLVSGENLNRNNEENDNKKRNSDAVSLISLQLALKKQTARIRDEFSLLLGNRESREALQKKKLGKHFTFVSQHLRVDRSVNLLISMGKKCSEVGD